MAEKVICLVVFHKTTPLTTRMKAIKFLLFFLLISSFCEAQEAILKELSPRLVVTGDNLNFREKPDLKSKIKAQLNRDEGLTLLQVVPNEYGIADFYEGFIYKWIKVKRNSTQEIGYVFGEYVDFINTAYMRHQDCNRVQANYWYGVYAENNQTYIEQVTPK